MALIPNDVGLRVRTELDAPLRPIQPLVEIPAELTELRPGHVFSARIQEVLPENTYKALVAGKSVTLSLPEGAKAGDSLELVVIDRTPRTIIANLANTPPPPGQEDLGQAQHTTLSRTGQLIASLLGSDQQAVPSAPLNRGQPLVPQSAVSGAAIAPQLAAAVEHSGLFYEAHQALWTLGERPTASLLAEPQARLLPPPAFPTDSSTTTRDEQPSPAAPESAPVRPLDRSRGEVAEMTSASSARAAASPAANEVVPEEIRPLVQQQLDAAASQRLAWHGEIWPGQPFEWEIEREARRAPAEDMGDEQWRTTLHLTTPLLGRVDAQLHFGVAGLKIDIATPTTGSAERMRLAAPELEGAFSAAGIPLLAIHIRDTRSSAEDDDAH